MKTTGLIATIAIALPLSACMERDRCDSHGWCDDNTQARVCFYDSDCGNGATCQGGTCLVRPPVPPARDAGATSGAGGSRPIDAGSDSRDAGAAGTGGTRPDDAGISGVGGAPRIDGGTGTGGTGGTGTGGTGAAGTGGSRPIDAGTGGTGATGADGGPAPGCDAGGGGAGSCHVHPAPVCQFDQQCGLHGRCADGECQRACAASADCGTGQVCTAGYCVTPATSGGQCVFNADCGPVKTCINGSCHADCKADADCPALGRDRCLAGICQPATGPSPQCRGNADCVGVHVTDDVCVDAVCRTECLSDTDCCVGSSGSVCQMGYCLTAHEVAPQCRIDADCGSGKACLDAACE